MNVSSRKGETYVLMLLHLDLTEGTIACYYSSLSGTLNNGLSSMFSPCPIFTPSQQTPGTSLAP
jgi:hypothetical protein